MDGVKGILNSKRGAFALFIVACATVLAAIHILTGAEWKDMVKWIGGFVIVGHTATTAVDSVMAKKPVPVQPPTASS